MNLNTNISIPNTIFSQEVDDETIILDSNTQEYFNFSGVGKVIWDLLCEEKTLLEIQESISNEFEVEKTALNTDIINFITLLKEKNLVEINT
jgi:hypothetical protein